MHVLKNAKLNWTHIIFIIIMGRRRGSGGRNLQLTESWVAKIGFTYVQSIGRGRETLRNH